MTSTRTLQVPGAAPAYDVRGPLPPAEARPPLLASWQGEFPASFEVPDPARFGQPAEDDGARVKPLLPGVSGAVTAYEPDVAALLVAPTRPASAGGTESRGVLAG